MAKLNKFLLPAIVVAVHIFLIRDLFNKVLAYTDFPPFASNFIGTINSLVFVWNDNFLGYPDVKSFSYIFRAFFEALSFGNASIAQNMYLLFFSLLGYIGIFFVFKRFGINIYINYIISFFYFINPVISAELLNGAIGILIPYSLLPFVLLLLLDLLDKYFLVKGVALTLIVSLFLGNIQVGFWMLVFFAYIAGINYLLTNTLKLRNIFLIAAHCILALFANAIAFYGYLSVSGNYTNLSYLDTFRHNYSEIFFSNLFRFIGNRGSPQYTLGFFELSPLNLAAFVFPAIILCYITFFLRKEVVRSKIIIGYFSILAYISSCSLLFFIAQGNFDSFISNKNLLIVSLRNPQKLFYIFSLSYVLLIGLSVDSLYNFFKLKKLALLAACFVLSVSTLWVSYNWAFLGGNFGLSHTKGEESYYIGEKYTKLLSKLETLNGNVVVLPFDYSTQLKLSPADNVLFTKFGGAMTSSNSLPDAIRGLYAKICDDDDTNFLFDLFQIQYVVIDKNPSSYLEHQDGKCVLEAQYETPYIWGNYSFFSSYFKNESTVYEDESFLIKKIPSNPENLAVPFTTLFHTDSPVDISETEEFVRNISRTGFYYSEHIGADFSSTRELREVFSDISKIQVDLPESTISQEVFFPENTKSSLFYNPEK